MSQPNNSGANEYLTGEGAVQRATSVNFHLEAVKQWMQDDEITEVCVNRPGEVWCERQSVWETHKVDALTFDHCLSLATATAKLAKQDISDTRPILSAVLPLGERVQIVMPPAAEHGTVSVTIRKPSFSRRTLADYEKQGFFKHIRPLSGDLSPDEAELLKLKQEGDYIGFLRRAVELEKVIVVAGETGSGKTTFMKALMQAIPTSQRIITIEDVPELFLPDHPNHVHLFYPSEAKEEENAPVTAASLLKSCLRMKPTRILLAELRGGETFDFVNVCASGHGGSITSLHAGSCDMAFERMALMMLQNRQGRTLPYNVIKRLLYQVVDIVIHVHNDVYHPELGRHITELWYDPTRKRAVAAE
ncbi:P-type DNA transfer ATPase VirB11 [Salmonella enterica]|nr:P-type DNA transfer ATPase VirB11 [Salmonella enterica]